jgi:ComF family protein
LHGFDAAFSYGVYDGKLRQLIQLLKYGGIRPLAEPLAEWLSAALPRDQRFDIIVPMPIHWRRRWTRGFNQSELLARALSRRTGIPVVHAVRKRKGTPPQAGLTAPQRRANVASVFEASKGKKAAGRRILLVDDVLTTGATAGACARAMKRAGAVSVTVLTVARADRRVWVQQVAAPAGLSAGRAEKSFGSLIDGESGSIA